MKIKTEFVAVGPEYSGVLPGARIIFLTAKNVLQVSSFHLTDTAKSAEGDKPYAAAARILANILLFPKEKFLQKLYGQHGNERAIIIPNE